MDRKFRTSYDKYVSDSAVGSAFDIEYSSRFDDSGTLVLDVVGKRDVYSEIQEFRDSVDIYNILRRYAAGELDVLEKVQGFYADVSKMPKSYQEVLNLVAKTEQFFDSLPAEDKEIFNNSYSEFLVAMNEKDFFDRFPQPDVVKPPVDSESEVSNES